MPHFIIEYSANLADKVDIGDVLSAVQVAALKTKVFPLGGLRVRAFRCDDFLVADGHPDNCYLHMTLRMGHGREPDVKKAAGEAVFAALTRKNLTGGFFPQYITLTAEGVAYETNMADQILHSADH